MNKINYGFDAPAVMRNLIVFGIATLLAGTFIPNFSNAEWIKYLCYLLILAGSIVFIFGLSMYVYGIYGKYKMRDFVINKINWQGNEMVLDIGTGRGVYMIGAAKHLTTGKSIGIDIWRTQDLSGNNVENALKNAELENVSNKIEIKNEDARKLSFQDNTFDVILSMWCIHNIDDKAEQEKTCFEIARVLKPHGTALIGEFIPTHDYAKYFEKAGLKVISSKNYISTAYTLMWMVEAIKI
jgi:arsenite methyltransferase